MKTRRIEIRVTEDEFMWLGRYYGKGKVSDGVRELVRKFRELLGKIKK